MESLLSEICKAVSSLLEVVWWLTGKVISTFGVRGSSLILMGLLLSIFERFSRLQGSSSLFAAESLLSGCMSWVTPLFAPGESTSVLAEGSSVIVARAPFLLQHESFCQIAVGNSGFPLSCSR